MGLPSYYENILERSCGGTPRLVRSYKGKQNKSFSFAYANRDRSYLRANRASISGSKVRVDIRSCLYQLAFFKDAFHLIIKDSSSGCIVVINEKQLIRTVSKVRCQIVPFEAPLLDQRSRQFFSKIRELDRAGKIAVAGSRLAFLRSVEPKKSVAQKNRIEAERMKNKRRKADKK